MSQGRSPSGVASLRARFEQNKQDPDTSPPSRGRSPAASFTNEEARPLSKIRTNFVAVEPSKNMSSSLEVPQMDTAVSHGAQESNEEARKNENSKPQPDNTPSQRPSSISDSRSPNSGEAVKAESGPSVLQGQRAAADTKQSQGLGPILKGSPFEDESPSWKEDGIQGQPNQVKKEKPRSAVAPGPKKEAAINWVASKQSPRKEPMASKEDHVPSKASSSQKKPPVDKAVSLTNGNLKTARKPAILDHSTKQDPNPKAASAQPRSKQSETDRPASSSIKSPEMAAISPQANGTVKPNSSGHSSTKKDSTASASNPKRTDRDIKAPKTNGQLADHAAPTNTRTIEGTDQSQTRSKSSAKTLPPATGFIKPKPKSPTKPVKLPSSATAPTASSAAKHDGEEGVPQANTSRQGDTMPKSKTKIDTLKKPVRSVRSSLPANSRPLDKSKTKGRSSLTPSTASSGSFLERMMRPTQSSAQKVHEKFEPTSPPRRNTQSGRHSSKSKRVSGESMSAKSDNGDIQSPSTTAAQPVDDEGPKPIEPLPLTEEPPAIANEA